MIKKIFDSEYLNIGSGIQPFNAWLLIRGLRTLPARLERINRSTQNSGLHSSSSHPAVSRIIYPFDESFDQYHLAKKQMEEAQCAFFRRRDHSARPKFPATRMPTSRSTWTSASSPKMWLPFSFHRMMQFALYLAPHSKSEFLPPRNLPPRPAPTRDLQRKNTHAHSEFRLEA